MVARCFSSMAFKKFVLVLYILIFSAHAVVIKSSPTTDGRYSYNPALLCLLAESVKLGLSTIMFFSQHPLTRTTGRAIVHAFIERDWLMAGPALLYAVYNNLSFLNLLSYDANIYQVVMNSRILITGVLSVLLLKRFLSIYQWASLLLLGLGCAVANFSNKTGQVGLTEILFILLQASLSSAAGVYNELLLKKINPDVLQSIHLQNAAQYFYSIVFNAVFFIVSGRMSDVGNNFDMSLHLWVIILLMACGGLTASMILKHFSTITKAFATSVEMLLTGLGAWFWIGTELAPLYFVAFLMVSGAIVMYNHASSTATPHTVVPPADEEEMAGLTTDTASPVLGGSSLGTLAEPRRSNPGPQGPDI